MRNVYVLRHVTIFDDFQQNNKNTLIYSAS